MKSLFFVLCFWNLALASENAKKSTPKSYFTVPIASTVGNYAPKAKLPMATPTDHKLPHPWICTINFMYTLEPLRKMVFPLETLSEEEKCLAKLIGNMKDKYLRKDVKTSFKSFSKLWHRIVKLTWKDRTKTACVFGPSVGFNVEGKRAFEVEKHLKSEASRYLPMMFPVITGPEVALPDELNKVAPEISYAKIDIPWNCRVKDVFPRAYYVRLDYLTWWRKWNPESRWLIKKIPFVDSKIADDPFERTLQLKSDALREALCVFTHDTIWPFVKQFVAKGRLKDDASLLAQYFRDFLLNLYDEKNSPFDELGKRLLPCSFRHILSLLAQIFQDELDTQPKLEIGSQQNDLDHFIDPEKFENFRNVFKPLEMPGLRETPEASKKSIGLLIGLNMSDQAWPMYHILGHAQQQFPLEIKVGVLDSFELLRTQSIAEGSSDEGLLAVYVKSSWKPNLSEAISEVVEAEKKQIDEVSDLNPIIEQKETENKYQPKKIEQTIQILEGHDNQGTSIITSPQQPAKSELPIDTIHLPEQQEQNIPKQENLPTQQNDRKEPLINTTQQEQKPKILLEQTEKVFGQKEDDNTLILNPENNSPPFKEPEKKNNQTSNNQILNTENDSPPSTEPEKKNNQTSKNQNDKPEKNGDEKLKQKPSKKTKTEKQSEINLKKNPQIDGKKARSSLDEININKPKGSQPEKNNKNGNVKLLLWILSIIILIGITVASAYAIHIFFKTRNALHDEASNAAAIA